jgi:AcrR family transcriptional regulator
VTRGTPRRRRQGRPAGATAADTERRILDAALTGFAARGYDATSIRDIVAAAGVSMPTLYHHCRTKRDLFARLLAATCEEPLAAWERLRPTAADWRRLLTRFAAESFALARADARLPRLLFQSTFGPPLPEVADLLGELARRRFAIVTRLVRAGLDAKAILPWPAAGGADGLALAFCCLVDQHVNVLCRDDTTLMLLNDDLAVWLVGLVFGESRP